MAPVLRGEPPPDLHRWGEVGGKRRRPEADVADEACRVFTLHCPETVAAFGPRLADPGDESVGALRGIGFGKELHDYGIGVHLALEASERLASDGIDVEILDLRTLLPLDTHAIKETVAKTSKVLILHEDNKTGGIGAEVAALIAEESFEELDGPIMRLAAADTHIPYAPSLEEAILPNAEDVVQAARRLAEY